MERQRSFLIKSTTFLVFSFSISLFVFFLLFFSIWVTDSPSSVREQINFVFRKSSPLDLSYKPLDVQNLSGFGRNFSSSRVRITNFTDARLRKVEFDATVENVSDAVLSNAKIRSNASLDSFVVKFSSNNSASGVNSSVLVNTHVTIPEIAEESSRKSVPDSDVLFSKNGEFRMPEDRINKGVGAVHETKQHVKSNVSTGSVNVSYSGEIEREEGNGTCDVTKGRWVRDESYPLYTNATCPFIDEGFNCQSNGRLDKDYVKWRWQPQGCDIPRFNATKMLELIRGKRLVFVGDSINRNQWESMLCLLMGAVKDPKKVHETRGRRITKEKGNYCFKFVDFRCTVEFYVTHFLVHESKARVGKRRVQTLRIDAIDKGSSRWKGADIIVFNTAHWWNHYKTKSGVNYFQEGGVVHPYLEASIAFRKALGTWASWIDKHINPRKTQVFYRSSAPSHFRGGKWNAGGHCQEASQPLSESNAYHPEKNTIVEEVLREMKTPVTLLNITGLSGFRIDGHPSIYGTSFANRKASSGQDCSHWCLPGVPDTWNELLYFHSQLSKGRSSKQ